MKEATGELNMTLVTIIAIAAVLTFVVAFLPGILDGIGQKWDDSVDQGDNLSGQAGDAGASHGGNNNGGIVSPGMILYY